MGNCIVVENTEGALEPEKPTEEPIASNATEEEAISAQNEDIKPTEEGTDQNN